MAANLLSLKMAGNFGAEIFDLGEENVQLNLEFCGTKNYSVGYRVSVFYREIEEMENGIFELFFCKIRIGDPVWKKNLFSNIFCNS